MGHTALEMPRPMMAGARLTRMADPVTSMELRMAILRFALTKRDTGPQARTRPRLCARTMTLPTRTWPGPEWVMVKALMGSRMPSDPRYRKVQVTKPAQPGGQRRPLISAEIRVADNDGGANSASVGVASEKAGGASGGMGTMRNIELVAHAAHGSKRVPKPGPNALPVRSTQARGLTNTGNTCFLNASLQCLGGVQELGETRARQQRQRRTLQSRLFECISQLHFRPSPYYTPRPLLDALPRLANQFQIGQQTDANEFLILLLGKMDQGGPREVFYGSIQTALTCSICPYSLVQEAATAHLSLNLEPSTNSTINQCLEAFFTPASTLDEYRCDSCGRVGTSRYLLRSPLRRLS